MFWYLTNLTTFFFIKLVFESPSKSLSFIDLTYNLAQGTCWPADWSVKQQVLGGDNKVKMKEMDLDIKNTAATTWQARILMMRLHNTFLCALTIYCNQF